MKLPASARAAPFAVKALFTALIVFLLFWNLYQQEFAGWQEIRDRSLGLDWPLVAAAALLVFPNYALEAFKWRYITREWYPGLSFAGAVKGVLAGCAAGLVTPGGIGDYAGRLLSLEDGRRVEAGVATVADRFSQMFATMAAGLAALFWLDAGGYFGENMRAIVRVILPMQSVLCAAFLAFLVHPRIVWFFLLVYKWGLQRFNVRWRAFDRAILALMRLPRRKLWAVQGLSFARYAVFAAQYYLLILAFGYDGGPAPGLAAIAAVFLTKSFVPRITIAEFGLRETIAQNLFPLVGMSALPAVAATLLLYVINILLPAAAGVFFIYRLKLPRFLRRKKD